jgi:hypothetical protein
VAIHRDNAELTTCSVQKQTDTTAADQSSMLWQAPEDSDELTEDLVLPNPATLLQNRLRELSGQALSSAPGQQWCWLLLHVTYRCLVLSVAVLWSTTSTAVSVQLSRAARQPHCRSRRLSRSPLRRRRSQCMQRCLRLQATNTAGGSRGCLIQSRR